MTIPGGPWIHAISGDSNTNLTAAFWLSLSVGSKKAVFSMGILSEGAEIPNNTSTSLVVGGVDLTSSYRRFQQGTAIRQHRVPTFNPEGDKIIRSSWFRARSILYQNTISLPSMRIQDGPAYHK